MTDSYSGAGPHIRCEDSTRSLMLDVLIALAPSFLWGFYAFGARAITILILSLLSCVGLEALCLRVLHRSGSVADLSACVTGAILAAALPAGVPLWLVPLGAFFAVVLGKAVVGGLGKNPLNPALFSLTLLYLLFPEALCRFPQPFMPLSPFAISPSAEALAQAQAQAPLPALLAGALPEGVTLSQLLTGSVAGGIASSSVLLLLAGGLYLLVRRVISWHIPAGFLGSTFALTLLLAEGSWGARAQYALLSLCAGSLVFLAVFAATDPVTSPITGKGKFLYGVLAGAVTVWFRRITGAPEGAVFAILAVSLLSRPLDYLFRPRVYGKKRELIASLRALPRVIHPRLQALKAKFSAPISKKKTENEEK